MSRCRLNWLRDSAGRGCSRRPLATLGQKTLRFERDCLMTAIVFAPAQPVRRVATCIAAVTALTLGTFARNRPAAARAHSAGTRAEGYSASGAAGTEGARRQTAPAACTTGSRSARRPAGRNGPAARGLFAVDQVLRQGQRAGEGSLPHREGSPSRDRPVPRRRRADRAAGRGEEAVPRHASARHAAPAGHAHAARQGAAAAGPLHRLPAERLHGGLRRDPRLRRRS